MIIKKESIILIVITLSLAANAFFISKYFLLRLDYAEAQKTIQKSETNRKIVDFGNLFIKKVLKAEADVDFEDRLTLETAVRELKDEEILLQWQKFTEAETNIEAQTELKSLLELLFFKLEK